MSQQEVDNVEKQWQEAFAAGDAAGVASLYAPKGRILPPNNDTVEGRGAIEEFVKGFLAVGAKLSFSADRVYEGGDLVIAVGSYRLQLNPPGAEAQDDKGKYIEVLQRQGDGSLQLVEDMFNSSVPAP